MSGTRYSELGMLQQIALSTDGPNAVGPTVYRAYTYASDGTYRLESAITDRDSKSPNNPDGNAYFGIHDEGKQIALDYASRAGYDSNIIEVKIPRADFEEHFARYVTSYDGRPNTQVVIPNTAFDLLNRYPRSRVGGQ
ncbi:MAG: hypothetical protein ACJ73S_07905 [Mycobacteriales bacterium]